MAIMQTGSKCLTIAARCRSHKFFGWKFGNVTDYSCVWEWLLATILCYTIQSECDEPFGPAFDMSYFRPEIKSKAGRM
jgi:hypothetical protein